VFLKKAIVEIQSGGQEMAVMVGQWLQFKSKNSGEFCAKS